MGVVTISSLSFCFGRAGEILGQRRLYKIGVMLYAAGAGLGAISTSFPELLLARAVMAVGLAMALPMSTAILAASFGAQAAWPSSWPVRFGDRCPPDDWSHHRRLASARGRLAVDFLDELHHRSGGNSGGDKNLSRPRRAPPRTLRFPRRLSLADRLSRAFAGSYLRRQSRLDIALRRRLVRRRRDRARQFSLARAAYDQAARRRGDLQAQDARSGIARGRSEQHDSLSDRALRAAVSAKRARFVGRSGRTDARGLAALDGAGFAASERLVFANVYPQDFTGVNTDTGKGMSELKNYIDAVRRLPLDAASHEKILGGTAADLLKLG
jgi:hypothetical protein